MKQGTGRTTMDQMKMEPKSMAVNPRAVSSIGIQDARTVSQPLYEGRGFEAPKSSDTSHPTGSQGKH